MRQVLKIIPVQRGHTYTFYCDGYYRYSEWDDEDEVYRWRIKNKVLQVMFHNNDWIDCSNLFEQEIAQILELELAVTSMLDHESDLIIYENPNQKGDT